MTLEATPRPVEPDTGWGDALRTPFAALAAGDAASLEEVWELASRRLYALALWRTGSAEDARDVVQEVFVRLAEKRADLARVNQPHLWLLAVAHRAAVDATRRRARRRAEPLESAALVTAPWSDPGRAADAARATRLLASLPDALREAVALRHLGGFTFAEVAKITGVPTFTAASRCRLGLARLRRLLEVPS